jgi:hypothetical protein
VTVSSENPEILIRFQVYLVPSDHILFTWTIITNSSQAINDVTTNLQIFVAVNSVWNYWRLQPLPERFFGCQFSFEIMCINTSMLSGFLIITSWRVLKLWTEETFSRYEAGANILKKQ